MSLSRNHGTTDANLTGKVVIGMDSPGPDEMTIQELEGKRQLMWDEATSTEYMARVKEKAKAAAKEIKILAELEAEAMRTTAQHEGYEAGLAQAQEEIQAHVELMTSQTQDLLTKLGANGATLFDDRREDILSLIRLTVEKTLNVVLEDKKVDILKTLMTEALERIESQRKLNIKCPPAEVESLEQFLTTIQERNPALKYWSVKGDPSIEAGGVVVEGADGKVDNTVATRWEGVQPIFEQLAQRLTSPDGE